MYHGNVGSCCRPSCVTRVRRFSIHGFDYVVSTVKCLIADKLYLNRSVAKTLDCEDSDVLKLFPVQCHPQNDCVIIAVGVVVDRYIIDVVIAVEVKVVDP